MPEEIEPLDTVNMVSYHIADLEDQLSRTRDQVQEMAFIIGYLSRVNPDLYWEAVNAFRNSR